MTAAVAGETFRDVLKGFECGPVVMEFTPASIPGTGCLALRTKRHVGVYAVGPGRCDDGGRAFRLVKVGGGSDKDLTDADVLVTAGGHVSCCCKGFARWSRCKHSSAVAVICSENLLPEPRVYRDED